jgi:hypothetical protein
MEMLIVCYDPKKLEEFRDALKFGGRHSYAENGDKISRWMAIG